MQTDEELIATMTPLERAQAQKFNMRFQAVFNTDDLEESIKQLDSLQARYNADKAMREAESKMREFKARDLYAQARELRIARRVRGLISASKTPIPDWMPPDARIIYHERQTRKSNHNREW
jgi:hypothetical protein